MSPEKKIAALENKLAQAKETLMNLAACKNCWACARRASWTLKEIE